MRLLDVSFQSPAKNVAFDEVLLTGAEEGKAGEVLRFWESPVPFVVLGVAQQYRREVFVERCRDDNVQIVRRCSAGGCVYQAPGCLNYTLVLERARHTQLDTIRSSYCFILGRMAEAIRTHGLPVRHNGISDLALRGKKVSGNAQKRRRNYILHHGTLLYAMDLDAIGRYVREPEDRPRYRGDRSHAGFVRNLSLTADKLRAAVCAAFEVEGATVEPQEAELEAAKLLTHEKYTDRDWTFRR
ncbi:MAG TPA: lipoate--protein ligase family protein [Candidatus Hydrogenedentes bacterium]|nr:lipoate--protein ligase family protein [Candidatus Hydrogenedentota bacterium]